MRYSSSITLLVVSALLLTLTAGCTGTPSATAAASPADQAYARGLDEYAAGNYRIAEKTFSEASALYAAAGDAEGAKKARDAMFRAFRTYVEYSLNRSAAAAAMREAFPDLAEQAIRDWLETGVQTIVSENETLYYDAVQNYLSAHPGLRREVEGTSVDMDVVGRWALSGNRSETGPYGSPVRYQGTETLAIPHEYLPSTGIIRIWFPLPVETGSQQNVTVTSLSYPEYIVKGPFTTGDVGYVYYEIPGGKVGGDLVLTADIGFTSYEQYFTVDPAAVGEYNTSDPEYLLYTASERNIEITDAIRAKAREIVGNETNPYRMAQRIYAYVLSTYTYSHVPHVSLDVREPHVAESTYMFETGHGDCGTQSMLFAALCRAVGIPARAIGGYQMLVTETPSCHFWAQYFVPGYGWVPTDLTLAEAGEWFAIPDEKRAQLQEYYGHNLDPARFVIQKRVDVPMDPALPDDAVATRVVMQRPAVVSDTAAYDIDLFSAVYFSVDLIAVDT
ncbi:transglutaminase domain-containing protein [Methanoculleus sp. FWC-SCC1]|uniref:Transglutaminase domain-containing protein n=1 Tax=Methanoculleus frigidifontis TaxID=2584085 RepID=A0ABT8M7C7_9EURY|nr:transglutaminase-like domain-containing protein [Methanoculleus sp. FWC-SCC1]MDN7023834.1 transglutaminase domain-containing protein [Methanoculleus sp. FWC-SCC1]